MDQKYQFSIFVSNLHIDKIPTYLLIQSFFDTDVPEIIDGDKKQKGKGKNRFGNKKRRDKINVDLAIKFVFF